MKTRIFGWVYVLPVASLALLPSTAGAIYDTDGTLADPCAWASVIMITALHVGGEKELCSGTLITPDAVLTAGHCAAGDVNPGHGYFGETSLDQAGYEEEVDFSDCVRHHLYISKTNGIDLMVCMIDEEFGDPAPSVPIVPIMVPTGPARDWLQKEIYGYNYHNYTSFPHPTPEVIVVGAGANSSTSRGDKRWGSAWLKMQRKADGSTTMLETANGYDAQLNELEFDVIRNGDSGGGEFIKMPDGGWQQIGVGHASVVENYNWHEAAPSHLTWIEQQATGGNNDWTTPCHEYSNGEWVWQGDCEGAFPTNPEESYDDDDWTGGCTDVSYGGGYYSNAALTPPGPGDYIAPGEGGNSPLVPLSDLDLVYPVALSKAQNGDFGSVPTLTSIADYIAAEVEDDTVYPFLGTGYDASNLGFYVQTSVEADFNGDSNADYVYAYPYGECREGLLIQQLGGGATSQWSRDSTGVLGTASCGDYFGAAVAAGDFDGDGYDDLAVSAPGSAVGTTTRAGSLNILYGSSTGLTASGDQLFDQDSAGISDTAENYDFFGEALTAGDFNCDGYVDLAIGAPREDHGTVFDSGSVTVLYGSAGGLTTSSSGVLYQGVNGVDDSSETGDHFGAALAAGNFDGDNISGLECDDLAVGVPFEDLGTTVSNAGRVYVARGSSAGLTSSGDQTIHQNVTNVEDIAEADDHFGANFLVVNDGQNDGLSVQVPGEQCSSTFESAGQHRFYGGTGGLTGTGDVVNCKQIFDAFNSEVWGVLEHAVDYYAIRVLEEI